MSNASETTAQLTPGMESVPPEQGQGGGCPGCGAPLDPIRAGHVAIFEGRFHYFCKSACKQSFLREQGRPSEDDVETQRPPPVVAEEPVTFGSEPDGPPSRVRAKRPPVPLEDPIVEIAPRWWNAIDVVGVACGTLVPAVELLGAVAEIARLPLALAAWIALALRLGLRPRDAADPHPLVVALPTTGATGAACWAVAIHDPHEVGLLVFAAVSCASAIVVEVLVERARARIVRERARIERALDVPVHTLAGDLRVEHDTGDLKPGEAIIVDEGELVGVDATVVGGEARVVPWLGAAIEQVRREGDAVSAGARVLSGRLRATTTWAGSDRAWIRLLTPSATRIDVASPTARGVRLTVERGTPVAAALVGVAAFAANSTAAEVLAAACAGAIAFGAKAACSLVALHYSRAHLECLANGITYRDARAFERAASTDIAVLSARGTVLRGEPEIVAIEPMGAAEPERILSLAAGAETTSVDPNASAVVRAARMRGVRPDHVRNATAHAGLGIAGVASNGDRLVVGGRGLMLEQKIGVAVTDARVGELESQGRSVLFVALGDRLAGIIALQDGLRPGSRAAVQRLLDAHIEPVLLGGEARETCKTIGHALDIDHVRPEVLPAERGAEVRALSEGGNVVAVIGHPASDDGALGAADVAVAMGGAGSTPGEWSVVVASDDVRDAALALAIPHVARDRARAAIVIAAVPGVLALLAIGFGVGPLAVAPLAALVGAAAVIAHAREAGRPA
jgi:cation transport ATPase/YHS domain-containing protein